jgi:murein DD-endopeptidase MepM/ murein hydrolase activator NlpD
MRQRFFIFFGLIIFLFGCISFTSAQVATSTLQTQTDQTAAQINQLKADIAQLQAQLNATTEQKQTLQSAVTALNINIQTITKSIALTRAQILQADATINTLSGSISTTTSGITGSQSTIADSLRQLAALDNEPLAVMLLSGGTLSSLFDQANALAALRGDLENHIQDLFSLKTSLQTSKTSTEQKRAELAALQTTLSQQQQGLAVARDAQLQLLQTTKDQESNYQALIAQKKAQEAQSEQDLLNLGAQLNLTVNPSSLPPAGPVLAWPVGNPVITQYFGNTAFATQNPSVYNGHGHDGIDLRASPGTPIHAARSGVIAGTGNTDITCPGASFGKWIFIQHDDGLSTMYAHLSVILVTPGEQVTTGQVIAYSDTTGYAIGPHLHFGVYATDGSVIKSWPTTNPRKECKGKIYTMPVATLQAYLNPLSYLPAIGK